jgi:hypothetical protein
MKWSPAKKWNQRQQVAAILALAAAVALTVWLFGWRPLNAGRRGVEAQIAATLDAMRHYEQWSNQVSIVQLAEVEKTEQTRLQAEWEKLTRQIDTFPMRPSAAAFQPTNNTGHIDFKVALINAKERLQEKALAANVELPPDLGFKEAIANDADSLAMVRQLAAVTNLAVILIDLKVDRIETIRPLTPRVYLPFKEGGAFLQEYPVGVKLHSSYGRLAELLDRINRPTSGWVLRRLSVERPALEPPEAITVAAVLSAFVINLEPDNNGT